MTTPPAAEPAFLYPSSRQFPFDEACEQTVRALAARDWNVPGITVGFDVYGSGETKYRLARTIAGDDFRLQFGRIQGRTGRWNDTAAVARLTIPGKELSVYADESGPVLHVYAGDDWDRDKDRFINGLKVHSKLNREARWYLRYTGSCDCRGARHTHPGRRAPVLVNDSDLGREYDRRPGEPAVYPTLQVFGEFTRWLTATLLPRILQTPTARPGGSDRRDFFTAPAQPWTPELGSRIGPVFCFGESSDFERIRQGRRDPGRLDPAERYALAGTGYRLLPLSTPNDGTVPETAYDGYLWCGTGTVTALTPVQALRIPGHIRTSSERFAFQITPRSADGIWIADNAPYETRRTELFTQIKPRQRLTDPELADAERARARTLIPVTAYTGGYTDPVILINRELAFNEISLASGPWPERHRNTPARRRPSAGPSARQDRQP